MGTLQFHFLQNHFASTIVVSHIIQSEYDFKSQSIDNLRMLFGAGV